MQIALPKRTGTGNTEGQWLFVFADVSILQFESRCWFTGHSPTLSTMTQSVALALSAMALAPYNHDLHHVCDRSQSAIIIKSSWTALTQRVTLKFRWRVPVPAPSRWLRLNGTRPGAGPRPVAPQRRDRVLIVSAATSPVVPRRRPGRRLLATLRLALWLSWRRQISGARAQPGAMLTFEGPA